MPKSHASEDPAKRCLDTALRLLARRDHSHKELERKLRLRGFDPPHIAAALAYCHEYAYLDDERFACQYARELQRRGRGRRKIEQALRAKGLERKTCTQAVAIHCTDQAQLEQCRRVLNKKRSASGCRNLDRSMQLKLYRFLLGRGFPPEIVNAVLHESLEDFRR